MARQATETIPLRPETKKMIQEQKPDGWTYDYWARVKMGMADDPRR
jgi:hypothetical protein